MELKKQKKNQGGFTLIELVSVVIILGILAAVIVPKYFDMTGKAQDAAYKGALNEGVARFNMSYAQYIMNSNTKPQDLAALTSDSTLLGTSPVSIGDYKIDYTGGGTTALSLQLQNSAGTVLKFSNNSNALVSVPWPN